jgi:tRNA-specific 2-thiouridylase
MRVAAHLNIPFLTFDFSDVYKKEVADYLIAEYKAGRTPNPDVMCNKEVKFGAFLKKALSMGADFIATGHYAQNKLQSKNSKIFPAFALGDLGQGTHGYLNFLIFSLQKAKDPTKDQVYFLWTLKQKQLSKILFPVGHLNKTEVRKLAKKFKLPVAEKKDSQGICFLGAVDLKDFLKHYIKEKKGKVLNEKGEEIGFHGGVFFHTLGERHGFTITKKSLKDGAYYIVGKDVKKNILYVSQNFNKGKTVPEKSPDIFLLKNSSGLAPSRSVASFQERFCLNIKNINWINEIPKENKNYTAQVRYHGEFLPCQIKITGKTRAEIIFKKQILAASGQSCVIYDKDICLGGGVIA